MTDTSQEDAIPKGSVELMTSIMVASAESNFKTMDTLYERERKHRQALEVLIKDVLENLERAFMGSAREYEQAVKPLRAHLWSYEQIEAYATRHEENHNG